MKNRVGVGVCGALIVHSARGVLGKVWHNHSTGGTRLHVGHIYNRLDFSDFFFLFFF